MNNPYQSISNIKTGKATICLYFTFFDIHYNDELAAIRVVENLILKVDSLGITVECKSTFEAISYVNKEKVDLIFLDIIMPELS